MPDQQIYCVDTNVFMDWQARYYPVDVFTGLVTKINHLIDHQRILIPALVQEELKAVAPPRFGKVDQSTQENNCSDSRYPESCLKNTESISGPTGSKSRI